MDVGNSAGTGQYVLGQPLNNRNRRKALRLRTVAELVPEIGIPASMTTRSRAAAAAESIDRQHPVRKPNPCQSCVGASQPALFASPIQYHGGFVSLASGTAVPLRVNPRLWARIRRRRESRNQETHRTPKAEHLIAWQGGGDHPCWTGRAAAEPRTSSALSSCWSVPAFRRYGSDSTTMSGATPLPSRQWPLDVYHPKIGSRSQ